MRRGIFIFPGYEGKKNVRGMKNDKGVKIKRLKEKIFVSVDSAATRVKITIVKFMLIF